jgi:DNA-binding GntR family transcriptional regulator
MLCGHGGGMSSLQMSFRPPKTAALIADSVRAEIHAGTLRPGSRLPGEAELMATYGVSRPTLREALRMLEHDEVIEIRRGARGGARVRVPTLRPLARAIGDVMALQPGVVGSAEWIEVTIRECTHRRAQQLGLASHPLREVTEGVPLLERAGPKPLREQGAPVFDARNICAQ